MSIGIVVRVIAPCIASKTRDPAVVVMDEKSRYVISLLSGHIGGANRLAVAISEKLQETPVITTATDLHQVPDIDVIAIDNGLVIENPEAIKTISMAFLNQHPVYLHDPYHRLENVSELDKMIPLTVASTNRKVSSPAVVVDDRLAVFADPCLILRPQSLIARNGV